MSENGTGVVDPDVWNSETSRTYSIELRDPFGQTIAGPMRASGGAWTFGALLDALDITEVNVPFVLNGTDARAPYYFYIALESRHAVAVRNQ